MQRILYLSLFDFILLKACLLIMLAIQHHKGYHGGVYNVYIKYREGKDYGIRTVYSLH
jgi:hypothetical protein